MKTGSIPSIILMGVVVYPISRMPICTFFGHIHKFNKNYVCVMILIYLHLLLSILD